MPTTTHRTFHFSGLNTFKRILQFFFGVLLLEKCEVRSGNVTCVQKRAGPGPFVVQSRASPSDPQGGGGQAPSPTDPLWGRSTHPPACAAVAAGECLGAVARPRPAPPPPQRVVRRRLHLGQGGPRGPVPFALDARKMATFRTPWVPA